jgi:hemin uptake protein HemP
MQDKLHPSPAARPFAPTPVPPSRPADQGGLARRRFVSAQLFGETTEVEILHGESVYRLRLTSLGKLILTK